MRMELLKKWLCHPEELYNLVKFKMEGYKTVMPRVDEYCNNVGGQVLTGMSLLFSVSKLEHPIIEQDKDLAATMGLFLQKTNIIRDYLEDQFEDREFWPREIYQKIPSTDPSSRTQQIITTIQSMTKSRGSLLSRIHYSPIYLSCVILLAALSWQYMSTVSKVTEEEVHMGEN